MDVNNKDYQAQKEKRDRAVNYWKERVISDFLPPIDTKKRDELNYRVSKMKEQSENPKAFVYYTELSKKQ